MRTEDSDTKRLATNLRTGDGASIAIRGGPEEAAMLSQMHPQELRDRYIQIKEDYFNLKKSSVGQSNELKRALTRMRKLEDDMRREERLRRPVTAPLNHVQRLQEQRDITEFQATAISQLSYRNEALERKLKMASIHMSASRNNKPVMYHRVGPRVDTWLKGPPARRRFRTPPPYSRPLTPASPLPRRERARSLSPKHGSSETEPMSIPSSIRKMLEEAKLRIQSLEATRAGLEKSLEVANQEVAERDHSHHGKVASLEAALAGMRERLLESGSRVEEEATDAVLAARDAQRLRAVVEGLEDRNKTAEEHLKVERTRRKEFITENAELRTILQTTKDLLRTSQAECKRLANDHEELSVRHEVTKRDRDELQQDNERLLQTQQQQQQQQPPPRRVPMATEASAAPLRTRIAALERTVQEELREKQSLLLQLEEAVRREQQAADQLQPALSEAGGLKLQLVEARQRLVVAEQAVEQLARRRSRLQVQPSRDVADRSTQCRLDPASLEQQLLSQPVTQKASNDGTSSSSAEVEEKLARLHAMYTQKSHDLDEANSLLDDHARVYAELSEKNEALREQYSKREAQFAKKIQSFEELIKEYDERLKASQQAGTSAEQSVSGEQFQGPKSNADFLSQSLKFGKRDCVLEFHIDKAIFDSSAYDQQKTFVSWMMPFTVDDPLQHTDLAIGSLASYRHTSMYKIHIKSLKLLQDPVSVGVYVLLPNGYPGKVGETRVPLSGLLGSGPPSGSSVEGTCVVGPATGQDHEEQCKVPHQLLRCENRVLATLSYRLRLLRPSEDTASTAQTPSPDVAAMAPVPATRTQLQLPDSRVDHKRKTSLRRKLQDYKHRNGSIQETEDEEDEELQYGASAGSESEDLYQSNSNYLMNMVKSKEQSRGLREDNQPQRSTNKSSNKHRAEKSCDHVVGDSFTISDGGSSGKVRPTSSKSYKGRRKPPTSSKPFHRSLEFLPKDGEALSEDMSHRSVDKSKTNAKKRQYINRPRSAPRRDREEYHSTTSSPDTDDQDTFFEEEDEAEDDSETSASPDSQILHRVNTTKKEERQQQSSRGSSPSDESLTEERYSTDSEGVVATAVVPRKKSSSSGGSRDGNTVSVAIRDLILLSRQPIIRPGHSLFVSFQQFLPLDPKHLETPNSVSPPLPGESSDFKFSREYDVSAKRHPDRWETLCRLMQEGDPWVSFFLNSEPPDDGLDEEKKTCQELGVGRLNLLKIAEDPRLDGRPLRIEIMDRSGTAIALLDVAFTIAGAISAMKTSL